MYVQVMGPMRIFQKKRTLMAHSIKVVDNMDQVTFHQLMATYVHMYLTGGEAVCLSCKALKCYEIMLIRILGNNRDDNLEAARLLDKWDPLLEVITPCTLLRHRSLFKHRTTLHSKTKSLGRFELWTTARTLMESSFKTWRINSVDLQVTWTFAIV